MTLWESVVTNSKAMRRTISWARRRLFFLAAPAFPAQAAAVCEKEHWDCVIVTGDKDSLQLVSPTTSVCNVKTRMGQTETILYTPERFKDEYGFEPIHIIDLKALMGDSSDNIPGVPGIGEKTAMSLVREYRSLDAIYAELDSLPVKEGVRSKLREGEESARMSFWLATIVRDAPIAFKSEDTLWDKSYRPELYRLLKRLGFKKFIENWGLEAPEEMKTAEEISSLPHVTVYKKEDLRSALNADYVAVLPIRELDELMLCDGAAVYEIG